MLQLGCRPLDALLGGGLQSGIITKIYGEAGTGKTNICLQASREATIIGYQVAYIDTEGISMKRLQQLCTDFDFNKIINKIIFFNPISFDEQEQMIRDALTIENLGLLIIDTINLLYRAKIEEDFKSALRSYNRQMMNLQLAAREKNLYILVVEQVYADQNGVIKPFTNKETAPDQLGAVFKA